jgi:hypothetical protein
VVLDQLVGIDLRETVVVLVARQELVLVVEDLHIVVAKPAAVQLVAIPVVPPVVRWIAMVGVEHLVGKSWVVKQMVDQDVVVGLVVGQIVVAVELLRLE